LALGDRTPRELGELVGAPTNLLAHHLRVLEHVGLIERRASAGDGRRRYVVLRPEPLAGLLPAARLPAGTVLFVCTHNSARSQVAAALWRDRTGDAAESAGTNPAPEVHPAAVQAARRMGLDLADARPKGYDAVEVRPALVVSVCDRAHEGAIPFEAPVLHWSVPDPVADGRRAAFAAAFTEIERRVERLAAAPRAA
jgi:protein-tyrosine-phosphatase